MEHTCANRDMKNVHKCAAVVSTRDVLQVSIEHILIAIHSPRKWLTFLLTDVCNGLDG